jgi:hypothetical protein
MDSRGLLIQYLHSVHAYIPLTSLGMISMDRRQRNVPASIRRPALENRKLVKIDGIACVHYLLAGGFAPMALREVPRYLRQCRKHLELFQKGCLWAKELPKKRFHASTDRIQQGCPLRVRVMIYGEAQSQRHAPLRTVGIDKHSKRRSRLLKKKRWPSRLHHPVRDLRNF